MEHDEGWAELERLARATEAVDVQLANEYPANDTIGRWQKLFGYSDQEAVQLIGAQRSDGEYKTEATILLNLIHVYDADYDSGSDARTHLRRPLGSRQS